LSGSTFAALREANNAAALTSALVTGHSVGAALVTLAIPDLMFNTGSKLPGGLRFALYNTSHRDL